MEVELSERDIEQIEKGELARLYMIEIARHFETNKNMDKDTFFKLGKIVTGRFKNNMEAAKD